MGRPLSVSSTCAPRCTAVSFHTERLNATRVVSQFSLYYPDLLTGGFLQPLKLDITVLLFAEHRPHPCEGKCDASEKCYLSNGLPVCESRLGLCWVWGTGHYHTFDGLNYDLDGTCTYLLAASKGTACPLTPFSVSKKTDCIGAATIQVVTVHVYGFIIKLQHDQRVLVSCLFCCRYPARILSLISAFFFPQVNGVVNYIPVSLLRGKIEVLYKEGKGQLATDFGMQVVYDWNSTVAVTLDPHYKGKVYGLCGNFNGNLHDEFTVAGSPPVKSSVELGRAYRLFDGDRDCCTGCNPKLDSALLEDGVSDVVSSQKNLCAVLLDQNGPYAHCHSRVDPGSFYKSCVVKLRRNTGSSDALEQVLRSYSVVCDESSDGDPSGATVRKYSIFP